MPTCFSVLANVNAENKNLRSAHATGNVLLWRHRVQGQVTSSQGNRSQGNSLWIRGLTGVTQTVVCVVLSRDGAYNTYFTAIGNCST